MNSFLKLVKEIPYSLRMEPKLVLERKNRYRISTASPRLQIELRSPNRISRLKLLLVRPWVAYQGPRWESHDSTVRVCWSTDEGWWIEGVQTGRRTSPMPRVLGALLCGGLIWIYPTVLQIMLTHAEKTSRYALTYAMLSGVTLVLSGLVALYMWFGVKSGPSGFEHALRQMSKVFGNRGTDQDTDSVGDVTRTGSSPGAKPRQEPGD